LPTALCPKLYLKQNLPWRYIAFPPPPCLTDEFHQ